MTSANQIVNSLLEGDELPDSQMLGTRRERMALNRIKARRASEQDARGVSQADSEKEWERIGHGFKHVVQTDDDVRKRLGLNSNVGEALGVREDKPMPDWLKKIKGIKSDEDAEGDGEGKSKDAGKPKEPSEASGSKGGSSGTVVGKTW